LSLSPLAGALAPLLALYVGPDQVMPVMSVLATILGALMIFWHKLLGIFRRLFGLSKPAEGEPPAAGSADSSSKEPLQK